MRSLERSSLPLLSFICDQSPAKSCFRFANYSMFEEAFRVKLRVIFSLLRTFSRARKRRCLQKGIVLFVGMHVNQPVPHLMKSLTDLVTDWVLICKRIVRDLISYFFTPEKSTILPFAPCEASYRTFLHPEKVRFYPSLRAFNMTFNSVALPVQI